MIHNEIVDAVKAYSDRQDIDVAANVQTFILMAEARINRLLRIREQTRRVYTDSIQGREFYSIPSDFNGMRIVSFNSGAVDGSDSTPYNMHFVTPEQLVEMQNNSDIERVIYYTILDNQLQIHRPLPPNGKIEMVYYCKVPPLNEKNPTNWMSEESPDAYIAGVVAEIELFVKNYEVAKLWDDRLTRCIDEIKTNDIGTRWTGSSLTMRIEQ